MTQSFDIPSSDTIIRTQLANGIIVLIYPMQHVQSVVIAGSMNAGSVYEPLVLNGLASLTASALNRGTTTRDFDMLHGSLEDVGASLYVSGGKFGAAFGGKSLAEDLPLLTNLLADVLRNPAFPEEFVEQLLAQRTTALKYNEQDIRFRAGRAFREALYPPDHPYHYTIYGTPDTISALRPVHLADFHRRHYGPEGMIISVAGAVDPAQVAEMMGVAFGDWRNPDQPALPDLPAVTPPTKRVEQRVTVNGKTQSAIVLGTIGPSAMNPDYHAARLANSILGEFGMMGRIGNKIREEEGLAYYASSRLEGGKGPGVWSISAGVAPEDVDTAIELALDEVQTIITEKVSDEDLNDNQSYFIGRLPISLETPYGIASQVLSMERYHLGLDYLVTYRDRIQSITRDDILTVTQRYLNPSAMVIAVAGPPD